jgi:hypothetical protein
MSLSVKVQVRSSENTYATETEYSSISEALRYCIGCRLTGRLVSGDQQMAIEAGCPVGGGWKPLKVPKS